MKDMPLNRNNFEAAAKEMGAGEPAFYEKEWFAIKLLELIVNFFKTSNKYSVIFTGGTCLSKGYKVINRFSEDLDFIITNTSDLNKNARSQLRKEIIEYIQQNSAPHFKVKDETIDPSNNSKAFNVLISYPKQFAHSSLRSDLKLEMLFKENILPVINKDISSIIRELANDKPESNIDCLSPIEIAADKVSALTWRILERDRNNRKDDPAMIRHLHDLAALKNMINTDKEPFTQLAYDAITKDHNRVSDDLSTSAKLKEALHSLDNDRLYAKEYTTYVDAMSYDTEDNKINYEDAKKSFKEIVEILIPK